ncbi:MAG: cysteine--tRNA ligase [bacterium]|nr:cysteine--tRNA ligase [bacterium]
MLKLYNTLTKKVQEFKSINPPNVGMYTCGPTVYDYAHIGNFRTYTTSDLLLRTLEYNNFKVKFIMNLTDVGHLTGDNLGDADTGEDKMEKSAKREGKSAWDIAKFYTDAFLKDFERLNLRKPLVFAKATDHIKEQIELVRKLEEKGFTYKTSDGIYFDTAKFKDYGKLSTLDQSKERPRVEPNPEKKNPQDFALWKFSYPNGRSFDSAQDDSALRRRMEWESPWGTGFPGWHIECSAMSMKYLGESFDIHAGGVDLSSTHHPNEIAQSEAATGEPFVNYWVHGAFVLADGKRMSKSLGNNYKVEDLIKNGYDPITLRYLYLQTHYRQEMNFTWGALEGAQEALNHLRTIISSWDKPKIGCAEYEQKFLDAINNDLNMPEALAVMWELVKSDYPSHAKAESLFKFDKVLGLSLARTQNSKLKTQKIEIPEEIIKLVEEREELRKNKRFHLSDQLRNKIKKLGYEIQDTDGETKVKKIL